MIDTKAELIEQILQGQGGEKDIERTTKQMQPMISMMLEMVGGDQEEAYAFARRLAEKILPIVQDTARDQYRVLSDEQLVSLASFHKANPWYYDVHGELTEAISAVTQERAGPMMKELFDEYVPEEQEPCGSSSADSFCC